ncbi:methyltransferase (TIGR00027 family) [Spinactinospora alkalitolerans]|uniref:S-adenosyl-L-methionine-dependent methyltransferase n=1 Tax=Spinactinospora alkalitolerans TaxID=687207 RepID=A0A852U506_9ACTN|nr:SAM-dependent methyltransferase [Spinactinospora alkalitolerans]NYE50592.1 methyltransferase (TIGR00027 family) [Spinactinospora alkalitolerans]
MKEISYTAQWTAAARAVESERTGDRLFRDEYARTLAAPRGFELLNKYRGAAVADFIAVRTRYMDDSVGRVMAEGWIDQVVMVASGMDTRPYRLAWPDRTTVYEVDHAALLAEKHDRLSGLSARPRVRTVHVGADLAEEWRPMLADVGFDAARPTLWVAEGLLFFLTEEQAADLLSALAKESAPGSELAVDMTSASLLAHPMTQPFLRALREADTPWLFGTDDPVGFLSGCGWAVHDLKQPGEPGAGEDRWPYPPPPRGIANAPRNWLINAALTEISSPQQEVRP